MAKIAFILLCHKDAPAIIAQAERLSATGDYVAIHFDARAAATDYAAITRALAGNPRVVFAKKRVRCGWGGWSLVRATLNTLEVAVRSFPDATHFYTLSGDCLPVKSASYAHRFLDAADRDYIEAFDFFTSGWIKTGLREERLIYRHWFNERDQSWLFYQSLNLQRALGLRRRIPADIAVQIGSQWWCLRRGTIEKILKFCRKRRDVVRFFSTTWIPDETFFQTLVRHLVPEREIECRTLTFKMFSDYGMPVTFYNDHYSFLISQNYLFARKISPEAALLKQRLGALWQAPCSDVVTGREGEKLYAFLTGRGRVGARYGPRIWEDTSTLGPDRRLLMIVCRKWHVAKRLLSSSAERLKLPGVEYLFDEATCPMPDLGGIERSLDKRNRHRRALMRMLFEYHNTDRLMICLDPGNMAALQDFLSDRADARVLELCCTFDDQSLVRHATRLGLATENTPADVIARLLPSLRQDLAMHATRIRDADRSRHWCIRQDRPLAENATVLADFFDIDLDSAQRLSETPYLFAD